MILSLKPTERTHSLWCRTTKTGDNQIRAYLEEQTNIDDDNFSDNYISGDLLNRKLSEVLNVFRALDYEIDVAEGAPLGEIVEEFAVLRNQVPQGKTDAPGIYFVGTATPA